MTAVVDTRRPRVGVFEVSRRAARRLRRTAFVIVVTAAVALAFFAAAGRFPRTPDGDWFRHIEGPAQVVLLVLVVSGAVIGLFRPGIGAVVLALGGVGLGVVSAIAHPPVVALVVATSFVGPSVLLWVAWQRNETIARIAALAAVTTALLLGSWASASAVYDHYFGPAHPESATAPLDDPLVEWAWAGAVDEHGFTVVVQPRSDAARSVSVFVEAMGAGTAPGADAADGAERRRIPSEPVVDGVARVRVTDLEPGRTYRYSFEIDGRAAPSWTGLASTSTATTAATATASMAATTTASATATTTASSAGDEASPVRIAFASCARTGSSGAVFDRIRSMQPDLYVITGDLHYENIGRNDPEAFARAFDRVLTSPSQSALYRTVPIAYVWDDHDYGPNDADASSPSRLAARAAYERTVPHHGLVDERTINQAFSLDGVRLILLDTRSARVPGSTLLGAAQLNWLLDELVESSATHDLVIVVSPTPWIGAADPSSDAWAGFADERAAIADHIAQHGLDDVVIAAGDAHMVAIDDGTNADYSSAGAAQIPVLQAAALDRPGSVKGGPYSEGTFPGAGQFGSITVDRSGDVVSVEFAGHRYDGATLVTHRFEVPAD